MHLNIHLRSFILHLATPISWLPLPTCIASQTLEFQANQDLSRCKWGTCFHMCTNQDDHFNFYIYIPTHESWSLQVSRPDQLKQLSTILTLRILIINQGQKNMLLSHMHLLTYSICLLMFQIPRRRHNFLWTCHVCFGYDIKDSSCLKMTCG